MSWTTPSNRPAVTYVATAETVIGKPMDALLGTKGMRSRPANLVMTTMYRIRATAYMAMRSVSGASGKDPLNPTAHRAKGAARMQNIGLSGSGISGSRTYL